MSYNSTTWVTGDTITAAKLNNIESGIQESTNTNKLYLCTDTEGTLNHSYNDIKNALLANKNIWVQQTFENGIGYLLLQKITYDQEMYMAIFPYDYYESSSPSANLIKHVEK